MDDGAADQVTILGISGSLRSGSYNTTLLRLAARLAEPAASMPLWQDLAEIPPFNEDHEQDPGQPVQDMRADIARADAVLIATPEYNTTLPGQLKTMLDWASRPTHQGVFAGKPVAVIGASLAPYGAKWAQQATRGILEACDARLVGNPLCVPHADTAFTADGGLHTESTRQELRRLVTELTQVAQRFRSRTPAPAIDTRTGA